MLYLENPDKFLRQVGGSEIVHENFIGWLNLDGIIKKCY
jgi:hypothetical protein